MNKHELMYERIRHHGERLQVIFPKMADLDPVALCKKLRRIELKTERAAVAYCNGDIDTDEWERVTEKTLADLDKLLNFYALNIPVFVNGDPRGYALKIDDEYVREHNLNIHRDWGGYGIIAPDLREGE